MQNVGGANHSHHDFQFCVSTSAHHNNPAGPCLIFIHRFCLASQGGGCLRPGGNLIRLCRTARYKHDCVGVLTVNEAIVRLLFDFYLSSTFRCFPHCIRKNLSQANLGYVDELPPPKHRLPCSLPQLGEDTPYPHTSTNLL